MIDPTLRTGLVIAGILVLAVWGAYKLATPVAPDAPDRTQTTAD